MGFRVEVFGFLASVLRFQDAVSEFSHEESRVLRQGGARSSGLTSTPPNLAHDHCLPRLSCSSILNCGCTANATP